MSRLALNLNEAEPGRTYRVINTPLGIALEPTETRGRPRALSTEQAIAVRALAALDIAQTTIADFLKVSPTAVRTALGYPTR